VRRGDSRQCKSDGPDFCTLRVVLVRAGLRKIDQENRDDGRRGRQRVSASAFAPGFEFRELRPIGPPCVSALCGADDFANCRGELRLKRKLGASDRVICNDGGAGLIHLNYPVISDYLYCRQ
jgi:hypothetical protein